MLIAFKFHTVNRLFWVEILWNQSSESSSPARSCHGWIGMQKHWKASSTGNRQLNFTSRFSAMHLWISNQDHNLANLADITYINQCWVHVFVCLCVSVFVETSKDNHDQISIDFNYFQLFSTHHFFFSANFHLISRPPLNWWAAPMGAFWDASRKLRTNLGWVCGSRGMERQTA